MEAMVGNAADPKQVKRAKQKERLAEKRAHDDLAMVLSTVQGRRYVWGLLAECGVFRLSYVPGALPQTEFNEGRRSIGLKTMAAIHDLDPALYVTMAQEASNETKQDAIPEPTTDTKAEEETE
ncbi:MAG: Bbp19 family protein [Burkholderiales bacterium]